MLSVMRCQDLYFDLPSWALSNRIWAWKLVAKLFIATSIEHQAVRPIDLYGLSGFCHNYGTCYIAQV